MKHFISGDEIAYDTETTGVDLWHGDTPFAYSFCNKNGDTAYFEWPVDPFTRKVKADKYELEAVRFLLEDQKVRKIGHHIKFDNRASKLGHKISVKGQCDDTMIAAHICNSLEWKFELKYLSKRYGIMGTEDQQDLKKLVGRLRRRAKNLGWNLSYKRIEQPHGEPKLKPQVEADYWLPAALHRLHPETGWVSEDDLLLCRTYATKDAERTMLLWLMYQEIMTEDDLWEIYRFEMKKFWPIVYGMEDRGVRAFRKAIKESKANSLQRIDDFKPQLVAQAWEGFNPDSHHDVRSFVTEKLGIDVPIPKGKKLPSVGREFLQAHLNIPQIHLIARYRTAVKTFSSFFSKFEGFLVKDPLSEGNHCIHASFQQLGAATGRLSCRDPNLQNVMDPTVSFAIDPQHVRHVFGPRPDHRWLCVDYSNMEVRVFADIAQEPVMLAAIREGRDIHSAVANQIWGGKDNLMGLRQAIRALSLDGTGVGNNAGVMKLWKEWGIDDPMKLTENQRYEIADHWLSLFDYDIVKAQDSVGRRYARNVGKMVTFLKIYGGGLPGARKLLKDQDGNTLPDHAIREILSNYDAAMPRIQEYSRELIHRAKKDGSIRTLWGRRLSIDQDAPYRAVNYIVQGSSADLMKFSMIRCHDRIRKDGDDAHIIMTIHDELIFEARKAALTRSFIRKMCGIMADTEGRLSIPMPVEPKIVDTNWSEKKKVKFNWEISNAA